MEPASRHAASRLFVTGATGFIGSALLDRLAREDKTSITCLVRNSSQLANQAGDHPGIRRIVGDLLEPQSYASALRDIDVVIHLAAATGSASKTTLERVNIQGTAALIAACQQHRIRHFVYLSSIAATCPEKGDYPYATTKRQAEAIVSNSGLKHTIIRPTIVLGKQAPNWGVLRKLAGLPVVPLIGGGVARIQPIDLADLLTVVCAAIESNDSESSEVDVGGPDQVTFEDFLRAIRHATGKRGFPHLTIPALPLRMMLASAASLTGNRFPVTAGQLAPFIYDGLARRHPLTDALRAQMQPLQQLLDSLVDAASKDQEKSALARECHSLTIYLTGEPPDAYVVNHYVNAHSVIHRGQAPAPPIDVALLRFAAAGPMRARIADAYARVFRPWGLLRRKLVTALAILENSPKQHTLILQGSEVGLVVAVARIGLAISAFGVSLVLGMLLFGPRHVLRQLQGTP